MRAFRVVTCILLAFYFGANAQNKTVAERLGYSADTKLLILHADDLGVAHSENAASITALEKGPLNSASIMVPCSWFPEIASYARNNKAMDFGLHMTLTSEWKNYKWGPVSSKDSVPTLLNKNGYFYALVDSLQNYADPKEVEVELRNQVKKAYRFGIDVTHLDAHMGAAASTPGFTAAYLKVGKEFGLPVLLDGRVYTMNHDSINSLLDEKTVVVDRILSMEPHTYKQGAKQTYTDILENLEPGLTFLLLHPAFDNPEMRAITIEHPDYGSEWRQADYDFLMSDACTEIIKKQNIKMITWREIRDKITREK
ncbi:polysaccharide deacetylase family protein [Maribacter hydrothermalis]|uniref:ChbG/HpnK family deacetylase n=1 Tax=Maribacter hydrothermalis TaxID=1836467 RepID=A0A1B7ZF30_9FLAO|nr:polysaccharide deacetylase family protein [Maribacter hydrothermalis]APQ17704.1 hypothetical protein BTR34_10345 [Maribacter hydrothermalis]OBR42179.1 hypothetical protein A9200_01970 [Maribacter hydrothermalis]